MPDDTLPGDVLPEVTYAVSITGVSSSVALSRWHCVEALHEPYECVVELAFELGHAPPIASLLEKSLSLSLTRGALSRHFTGLITEVEDRGVTAGHHLVTVVARPELWLLSQRAHNRVFQSVDSVAITRAVLTAAGLYAGPRFKLDHAPTTPPAREYCVQLGETDLEFITRILAEDGLTLAFEHTPKGETLLLLDGASVSAFTKVQTLDHAPVRVMGDGIHTASSECVGRLEALGALTSTAWVGRDWDFTHPRVVLHAKSGDGARVMERYPAGYHLGRYSGDLYGAPDASAHAKLRQQRAGASAKGARGMGVVTGFSVGLRVDLAEPGSGVDRSLDGTHLLTRVVHSGECPEVTHAASDGVSGEDRYANSFECVPVAQVFRPAVPAKPRVGAPQSAVVVGETESSSEEIVTDHYGRVRVRFHWDQPEARAGAQQGTPASCWLRVAQSWAGAGWGSLFIPRVGMEVVVQFLDGDPDRPFVAGCLYNKANEPPFELPGKRTRSVIRTQSTPRNGGFNELRFDDDAGHEEVVFRAQRDHKEHVLHDHDVKVDHDRSERIGHDVATEIGHDHRHDVKHAQRWHVDSNRTTRIGANDRREVMGADSHTVHDDISVRGFKNHRLTVDEGAFVEVGGDSGTKLDMLPDEATLEAPSTITLKVGGTKLEMTTSAFKVECNGHTIEIGAAGVTVKSAQGAKVALEGPNVSVEAAAMCTVKGVLVKIN